MINIQKINRLVSQIEWCGFSLKALVVWCFLIPTVPQSFGQYCNVRNLDNRYEFIANVTFSDIDHSSGRGSTAFSNYTSEKANVAPGETYPLSVTIGDPDDPDYVFAFIDWNQNGILNDPGEVYTIVSNTGTEGPHIYTIAVPEDAKQGETRMRIVLHYNAGGPNPCLNGGYGEAEDYSVVVGDATACAAPFNVRVTNLGLSSADLAWNSNGEAFDLKWGPEGFDADSEGTVVSDITTTSYQLSGLSTGTAYDVYVRRDCGADETSRWAGPLTLVPSLTYSGGDISTMYGGYYTDTSRFCHPEPTLTVSVPEGQQLTGLRVIYEMTARNYAYMSEQRSMLYSPTLGAGDPSLIVGEGDAEGTYRYDRVVTFANGATGDVSFVLRAWRTWGEDTEDCNTNFNYVPNGTWQLIPEFEPLPTCLPPGNLTINEISRRGAAISWTVVAAGGYDYYYSIDPAPPGEETVPHRSTAGATANLSGLDMGTTYYVWVRANCGDGDVSSWVGTQFTTTAPWKETFETSGYDVPAGWQTLNGYWEINRREALLDADSYFLNRSFPVDAVSAFATTSIGPVESGDVFSFIYRAAYYDTPYAPAPAGAFELTIGVSADGGESFHEEAAFLNTGEAGWQLFTIGLDDYEGQTIQVSVTVKSNTHSYYFGFDDFYSGPPLCPQPLNPSVSAITTHSAVISWSEPPNVPSGGYEYYYSVSATSPDAATERSGTAETNTAMLTDLEEGQPYYFWVRSSCGGDDVSAWSIAGTFATELEVSSPWSENFDATTTPPAGWSIPFWQIDAGNIIAGSEGNILYTEMRNAQGDRMKTFTTPNVLIEEGDILSFHYAVNDQLAFGNQSEGRFVISVSEDLGENYVDIHTIQTYSSSSWQVGTYDLSTFAGKSLKIRFSITHVTGGYYLAFDEFSIAAAPVCPVVGTTSVADVGYTDATISWLAVDNETVEGYEYYLTDSNLPPDVYAGSYEFTTETEVRFDNLQNGGTFYFWIRTKCDEDRYGDWSPVVIFSTPALLSAPWTEGFSAADPPAEWNMGNWSIGSHWTLPNGSGNIAYQYMYFSLPIESRRLTTGHVDNIQQGDVFSFRYRLGSDEGAPPAGVGNVTISVSRDVGKTFTDVATVSYDGLDGWQECFVSLDDYAGDSIQVRLVPAVVSANFHLGLDDFYIGPMPCREVRNLSVSDLDTGRPTLSWDPLEDQPTGGYEYYYTTDTDAPDADTHPSGNTPEHSVVLESLIAGQSYYCWVRANCGNGDFGRWSVMATFTIPFSHDVAGIIYVKENGTGNGSSWGDATSSLQAAIDLDGVSQVWVAAGTYIAPEGGFTMKNEVAVYGGFPNAGSPDMAARNWALHETILSGGGQGRVVKNEFSESNPLTASAVLDGFIIENGVAVAAAGGWWWRGAGIYNSYASPSFANLVIRNNNAGEDGDGGGMYNAEFSAPRITNVIISNNVASIGGGLHNERSAPVLTNVTISNNTAAHGGSAMANSEGSFPLIRNSIIYGNEGEVEYGSFIYNYDNTQGNVESIPTYTYSLIEGSGGSGNWRIDFVMGEDGGHNIDADPEFVAGSSGDYTLKDSSPAINKGNNNYYNVGAEIDLSHLRTDVGGNPRLHGGTVDIGAYEFQGDPLLIGPDENGIIYVKPVSSGTGSGDNWADAMSDLQRAIQTDGVQQVWVASGTYPAPSAGFRLKNGVTVYGGFPGAGNPDTAQRNRHVNETILSGNGERTVINNLFSETNPLMPSAVLDGFTVTAGYSDAIAGGILNYHASPRLVNLIVTGNEGLDGGGITNYFSSPTLTNVIIRSNKAVIGGGMTSYLGSSPVLRNVRISENTADYAAGMGSFEGGQPKLVNVTISGNSGGLGNGVYHDGAPLVIYNSIIWGNGASNVIGDIATSSSNNIIQGRPAHQGSINPGLLHMDNPAHARYLHPGLHSPAVDAGSNSRYKEAGGDLEQDFDAAGNPRLYGQTIDLGAFENQVPRVVSVDVPADKTYKTGDELVFNVHWTGPVFVTGYPSVPVVIGDKTVQAVYTDGSGSDQLLFSYTVAEGDEDTDGIGVGNHIVLNEGAIAYGSDEEEAALSLYSIAPADGVLVDAVRPSLTTVSIHSDNVGNQSLAKPGDVITLTFTASESIAVPIVRIAGQTAEVNGPDGGEANKWTATYTVTSNDEEGTIVFNVAYADLAGNEGEEAAVTTDDSAVVFDKTPPATPSSLAVDRDNGQLTLTWDVNAESDFVAYRIYFGTDEGVLDQQIDITDISVNNYTHEGLSNGTAYYYRIAAIDKAGNESALSDRVGETPKATQTITFDELEGRIYGDVPFALSASASSGQPVSFESSDEGIATIGGDGVTVTIHAAGRVVITAYQPGDASYEPAETVARELMIEKAKPVITWPMPEAITYGTPLGSDQLNATTNVVGLLTYTPAAETVLGSGAGQPLHILFAPADTANYDTVTAQVVIDVLKARAVITAEAEQEYIYDGNMKTVQATLNHSEGTLVYTPQASYMDAGSYAIGVSVPETTNYRADSTTVTLRIVPAAVTGMTLRDTSFIYDGTPRSVAIIGSTPTGTLVSYTINGTAGNSATNAGIYRIAVAVSGANYVTFTDTAVLTISKAQPVITAAPDQTHVYDGAEQAVSATVLPAELQEQLQYSPWRSFTDVVAQRVRVYIEESTNYLPAEAWVDFSIVAAGQQGLSLPDRTVTYDGNEHNLSVQGLSEEAEVVYTGNGQINAGEYEVKAVVSRPNYADTTLSGILYINKASAVITAAAEQEYGYDGTMKTVQATLNHSEGTLSYTPQSSYIDAGTYTIKVWAPKTTNYHADSTTVTLRILPAVIPGVRLQDTSFVYDGTSRSLSLIGSTPEGTSVSYTRNGQSGNSATDAGVYRIAVAVSGANYVTFTDTAMLTISKVQPVITAPAEQTHIYDGMEKAVSAAIVPAELQEQLQYSPQRSFTDVVAERVRVYIEESTNHLSAEKWVDFAIIPGGQQGLSLPDHTVTYDGNAHSLSVQGLPEEAEVVYIGNAQVNVGAYEIKAVVSRLNYADTTLSGMLYINKAAAAITASTEQEYVYNGDTKTIQAMLNHNEGTLLYTPQSSYIDAGTYTIKVSAPETTNYQADSTTVTLRILPAVIPGLRLQDTSFVYDGTSRSLAITGSIPEVTSVSYTINGQPGNSATNAGVYTVAVVVSGANYVTFTDTAMLTISKVQPVITAPAEQIHIYDGMKKAVSATIVPAELQEQLQYSPQRSFTDVVAERVRVYTEESTNYMPAEAWVDFAITPVGQQGLSLPDRTVTYDGNAHSLSVQGLPEEAVAVYTGNGQVNAGEYEVKAVVSRLNYADTTLSSTLYINKAAAAITASAEQEHIYDGGMKVVQAILNHSEGPLSYTPQSSYIDAGTYTVKVSAPETTNYQADSTTVILRILPAVITGLTFQDTSFIYDGTSRSLAITRPIPEGTSVSYTINGQPGNIATNAGVYTLAVVVSGANYITFIDTAMLTISKAQPVITALAEQTHIYDGTEKAVSATIIPAELQEQLQYSPRRSFTDVMAERMRVYTEESTNYLPAEAWVDFSITPVGQQGLSLPDRTVTYDGNAHSLMVQGLPEEAVVAYIGNGQVNAGEYEVKAVVSRPNYADTTLSGTLYINKAAAAITASTEQEYLYDGDTKTVQATLNHNEGTLLYTPQTSYVDAGTYTIKVSAPETTNYRADSMTVTLRILPAVITELTLLDTSFVYNGISRSLTITGSIPEGTSVRYTINGQTGNSATNAGVYRIAVAVSGANYLTFTDTAMLTISKVQPVITAAPEQTHAYDGTDKSIVANVLPASLQEQLRYNPQRSFTDVTVERVRIYLEESANYLAAEAWVDFTIMPALQLEPTLPDRVVEYDGQPHKLAVQGLATDATVVYTGNGQVVAGYYEISAVVSRPNYADLKLTGVLTINKAQAQIVGDEEQQHHIYDGTPKQLRVSLNHTEAELSFEPSHTFTEAGTYSIIVSAPQTDNYLGVSRAFTLRITPAAISRIALHDGSFLYDGTAKSLSVSGVLPPGFEVTYVNNSRTDAGTQQVTATISGDNYTTLELTAELTVTPTERTLDFPPPATRNYGDDPFVLTASAGSGETVTYTSGNPSVATVSVAGDVTIVGAGVAAITATVPANSNYSNRPSVSRELVVNKAAQSITMAEAGEISRNAGSVPLQVTSSSGLPVTLEVDDPQVATISGTTLQIHRLGTVRVTAKQSGNNNYEAAQPVSISVRVTDSSQPFPVRVHPALSPNGDGINDYLYIEGIKDYPENRLVIVDRNGQVLYDVKGYDNDRVVFTGRSNNRQLSAGTYFYMLEAKVNGKWEYHKGYFVLKY